MIFWSDLALDWHFVVLTSNLLTFAPILAAPGQFDNIYKCQSPLF